MLRMSLMQMETLYIALHLWMKYGWMSQRNEITEINFVVRGISRKRGSDLTAFVFLLLLHHKATPILMIMLINWCHL